MLRSLFAGVSGLRNHQVRMDVIGNNVANVNTVGFKAGRVTFQEGFAQVLRGANRPSAGAGGTNPMQVGLGMQVGSIDTLFTQGNLEATGVTTDLAIQGDAFFVVARGNERLYTRAGNFRLDADGRLVSPTNGYVVQGRAAVNGVLTDSITDIRIPFGQRAPAQATTRVLLAGNLDAAASVFDGDITDPDDRAENAGAYTRATIATYDSLGNRHELQLLLWKTGENEWSWMVDFEGMDGIAASPQTGSGTVTFNPDGTIDEFTVTDPITFQPDGAEAVEISIDPGQGTTGLTQMAGSTTAVLRDQDGYPMGELQNFSIDRTGVITGAFTNGVSLTLGQIVLADFNNPEGLVRMGNNMYGTSANSGNPILGFALEGSQSFISSGALEMSNVDLAQEFTNMIIAQRGFQANGRVITNSDEMLQEVVNLKR